MKKIKTLVLGTNLDYGTLLSEYLSSESRIELAGVDFTLDKGVRTVGIEQPDLVLLGTSMANSDLGAVVKKIRDQNCDVRICLLTVFDDDANKRHEKIDGVDCIVPMIKFPESIDATLNRMFDDKDDS